MRKAAFDQVKLRVTWNGERPCEVGDELVTGTGRRYQVLSIKGKQYTCMVLPGDASVQSTQWNLTWNRRK